MKYFPTKLLGLLILGLVSGRAAEDAPIRSGDRVAIVGNTFADQLRIHGYLESLLLQHDDVSIRNLGWGGDMLTVRDRPTGFPTEESTLASHKTDVIVACFGMGESFAGADGVEDFESDLKSFIDSHKGKKYNGESEVRLVLVSPIAYEDRGKLTPSVAERNGDLKSYTDAMRKVSASEAIPFVDLFETSRYLMNESSETPMTTNGIHLNSFGYWAISHAFFEQLSGDLCDSWQLTIDAEVKEGSAEGVELSELVVDQQGLRFVVSENSAPSLPPPPMDGDIPAQLSSKRDTLTVTHLKPGGYTLSVDGVEVVTAKHDAWAKGVVIDSSPAHQEATAFRAAINDKNLQFTYSWKALNQVHIVGERRSSPSGRALPKEVKEFHQLAEQRESTLRGMVQPKTRQWRLTPAEN